MEIETMGNSVPNSGRVPFIQKFGFGVGSLGEVIMANLILGLANAIYNIEMGVPAWLIGIAVCVPRLWDAFTDPVNHLDAILSVSGINAIQWVQPPGDGRPIIQWVDLIKRIQQDGKSVVVDLEKEELDDFMEVIRPEGIFLCIASNDVQEQKKIVSKVEKW